MSTYAGQDNCTDIILDFIAEHESAGNYNAVIGDVRAKGDLSRLTIDEIYQLQDRLLAEGQPSTAVGRYQILRRTLQGLQKQLKLAGTERFTPELQDRLAVKLLIGRGYKKWWRDAITDIEFAHALSKEWASLPDPDNDGRSHYDGVGNNRACTTLESVYLTLREARAVRKDAAQPTPAPTPTAPPEPSRLAYLDLLADITRAVLNVIEEHQKRAK